METKVKKFDAVKYMRQQRKRLSKNLAGLSTEEIIAYFKKVRKSSNIKPNA